MTSDGMPSDDVLLELGRLTWAAINLEDDVYLVCRSVEPRGGPFDDTNIGPRIDLALKDLEKRPGNDLRHQAEQWLIEAAAALRERNAVLHSTHIVFIPTSGQPSSATPPDPELVNFPRNRSSPAIHTPLTLEGLGQIHRRLENARSDCLELAAALWDRRPA
jgi:hypothetical protein